MGSGGVKQSQVGSGWVKWSQVGSGGVKWGQEGSIGVRLYKVESSGQYGERVGILVGNGWVIGWVCD